LPYAFSFELSWCRLGGNLALFVLMVVGVVVGITWLDWRDVNRGWKFPDWARGGAIAGVIGVLLTSATSFASVWIQDPGTQQALGFSSRLFWPELVFLLFMLGAIVLVVRKKRLSWLVVFGGVLMLAFWLGVALS
jgi:hypothetical protein